MTDAAVPRVTVVIPAYNSASTIERCLRSVFAQTMRDVEIILTDDASTDDTAAVAHSVADGDPRFRLFRLPINCGKPHAMNQMIAAARGEWIAVLDADDAYRPDRLERLVGAALRHGVDMAADNLAYRDAGVGRVVRTGFDPDVPPRVIGKADLVREASSFASFDFGILKPVIRRGFIEAHGLAYFEQTRLAEDFYYMLCYMVAGGRCILLPEPLYEWTMPFGLVSRQWTGTGAGAWRYDYRQAAGANAHYLELMHRKGETEVVALLRRRSRQYRVMTHYIAAQRALAAGRPVTAAAMITRHPSTVPLLLRRVVGRVGRAATAPGGAQNIGSVTIGNPR